MKKQKQRIKNRFFQMGMILLLLVIFGAIFGPLLSSFRYDEIQLTKKNVPPSLNFWFGSDELGRDIFTRSWWGMRVSLAVAFLATMIDLIIGMLWGSVAAFFGGKVDTIMMRLCDILQSIPYLLMAILLTMILGTGFFPMMIAIALTGWITMARIIRGYLIKIRNLPFMIAAEAIGASKKRRLFYHFIPQASNTTLITLTLNIPAAIFTEAFLSFLGLGIPAPYASLGVMIYDGLSAMILYPWRLFIPGTLLCITLFGFYLLGEGLRQTLDPKWIEIP